MILTAIEFLGLAFFLGVVAGAVLEALIRPRLQVDVDDFARGMSDRMQSQHPHGEYYHTSGVISVLRARVDMFTEWAQMQPQIQRPDFIRSQALDIAIFAMIIAKKVELDTIVEQPRAMEACNVPNVALAPAESNSPTCSFCGAMMTPLPADQRHWMSFRCESCKGQTGRVMQQGEAIPDSLICGFCRAPMKPSEQDHTPWNGFRCESCGGNAGRVPELQ